LKAHQKSAEGAISHPEWNRHCGKILAGGAEEGGPRDYKSSGKPLAEPRKITGRRMIRKSSARSRAKKHAMGWGGGFTVISCGGTLSYFLRSEIEALRRNTPSSLFVSNKKKGKEGGVGVEKKKAQGGGKVWRFEHIVDGKKGETEHLRQQGAGGILLIGVENPSSASGREEGRRN